MSTQTRRQSDRAVAAASLSVAAVVTVWVSLTLSFDLVFHFHPLFLGVAAGWALRRLGAAAPSTASIAVVVVLSALGAITGTAIIESAGGPVDPAGFTAGVVGVGIAAGIYVLFRSPP